MNLSRAQRRQQERLQRKSERQAGSAPADTLDYIRKHFPQRERLEDLLDRAKQARTRGTPNDFFQLAERLVAAFPDAPETHIVVAEAAHKKGFYALFMSTLGNFCQRWPDHELAGAFAKTLQATEAAAQQSGITPSLAIGAQHDWMSWYLEAGRIEEARDLAQQLLIQVPEDLPCLNNLCMCHLNLGNTQAAREVGERILLIQPDNLHALANLVSCQVRLGDQKSAQSLAARLKATQGNGTDGWTKTAQALAYLGDDQGVLDAYLSASTDLNPMLTHLAAVAWARLDDWKKARQLWQEASKAGLEIARENLRNANLPPGQRHSAWSFEFSQWFRSESKANIPRSGTDFLKKFPILKTLLPALLDRGDPTATEFGLRLAVSSQDPSLLESAKHFALSRSGTDQQRFQAALACREAGLLPVSRVRMWQQGRWADLLLLSFSIHWEEGERLPKRVRYLKDKGAEALREGRYHEAEELTKRGLEQTPGSPGLRNNLAAIYCSTNRSAQGLQLFREIHLDHPDYPFATITLASCHIIEGEFDEARHLLNQVMQAPRIHVSEFASLCNVQIQLASREKDARTAEMWGQAWQQLEDEDEEAARFRPFNLP